MQQSTLAFHFVLSRHICRTELDETFIGISHILGRTRFICHRSLIPLLDAFKEPQDIRSYANNVPLRTALETLVNANIILPASQREDDVIRAFFATRFPRGVPVANASAASVVESAQPDDQQIAISGVLQRQYESPRLRYLAHADSQLVLASGLAALSLSDDEVLVTHFAARRLHVSMRVWEIACSFGCTAAVADVAARFAGELSALQVLRVCQFLLDRGILWPSVAAERDYVASIGRRVTDRSKPLTPIDSGCEQWEQKYMAYDIPALDVALRTRLSVAAIGFCQVHAYTPALQYLAQRDGIGLSVASFMSPAMLVGDRQDWSLILYSRSSAAAALYEAFALDDRAKCERLAKAIIPEFDRELAVIRALTDAPILVHSLGRPGLVAGGDLSESAHYFDFLLSRLNRDLEQCLKTHGNAWLLDEDRVVAGRPGGIFWDDEYNGLPHHSAVSLWGRPPRSLAIVGRPPVVGEDLPPIAEHQVDPAYCFAAAYLQFIERVSIKQPIRMIVFEPNELLWQGRLESKPAPHPPKYNFYTGDHYSLYIGLNEALMRLRRAGVMLVCNSSCPTELLTQRWKIDSAYAPVVRFTDLYDAYGGADRSGHLQAIMGKTGVSPQEVLYIDLCAGVPADFNGRVYSGDKWGLRRYLLSAAHLHPMARNGEDDKQASPAREISSPVLTGVPTAQSTTGDGDDERVKAIVYDLLIKRLRCSQQDLQRTDDLRLLGLDSLGAQELVAQIEAALQIRFHDSDYLADTVFFASGLLRAAGAKLRNKTEAQASHQSGDGPVTDSLFGGMSYEQWCNQDLAAIIARHIEAPGLPWIVKTVRSPAKFDYEYHGWHALYAQACGYQDLYQANGLQSGDVVTLLLPQSSGVVAAWLGAILGRFVPSISAYPGEKLSVEAFVSWFGKIVEKSQSRLVVCTPELRELVENCIAEHGMAVPCLATVPSAVYGREPPSLTPQPDRPALLQHSSGTTGLKKAVLLSHRAVLAQLWDLAHALKARPSDSIVSWLPLYHDMGLIASLVFPLVCTLRLVLISPFHWARQPAILMEQITEESASLCWLPNFAFLHCAKRIPDQRLPEFDLSSLRAVVSCSEPITANAQRMFADKFDQCGFRMSSLSSSYAMAETTFAVTQMKPGKPSTVLRINRQAFQSAHKVEPLADTDNATEAMFLVSSGSLLPHAEVRIVDEAGAPVAPAQAGEVCIRGDYLMQGYCNDAETTSKAMRDGWYCSGDLGFIYRDELYITGRKKEIIITAGQNVSPHDVEDLAAEVQGVRPGRIVAFGVFDPNKGTEILVVLAELIDRAEADGAATEAVRRAIHEKVLSGLGVSIGDLRFYPAQTLQKSTSGKLSRHSNRVMYLADVERERSPVQPVLESKRARECQRAS